MVGGLAAGTSLLASAPATTAAEEPTSSTAPERPTAPVVRRDLSEVDTFDATVDHGESWELATGAKGTVTWRPEVGAVIEPGGTLIRVDDKPVVLARGEMPMYREIGRVQGGEKAQLRGADVAQLQDFLRSLGFDEKGTLQTDGVFGAITERAIKAWQTAFGLPVTGKVDSSQLVFSPTSVRIATAPRVGTQFEKIEVTTTTGILTFDVEEDKKPRVGVGTEVVVELEDGTRLDGTIESLTSPEDGDDDNGAQKWRATVTVDGLPGDTGGGVQVQVTTVFAKQALTVPVGALLAPANGGFAVEVVDGGTTRLVVVEIGSTVVDGQIDITGDIAEGDVVVVTP
jgi:hypothetical protein